MKLEECKRCEYHYRSQLDDILCRYAGGIDYRVVATDNKGNRIVMCPLEVPLPKRISLFAHATGMARQSSS